MSTARERFEEEVQSRIDTKKEDPACVEDNPGFTDADWRRWALEDMEAMGPDYGGAFEEGISPTYLKADGSVDHAAMKRQAEYVADMRRQAKEWQAIRRLAMRELAQAEVVHGR